MERVVRPAVSEGRLPVLCEYRILVLLKFEFEGETVLPLYGSGLWGWSCDYLKIWGMAHRKTVLTTLTRQSGVLVQLRISDRLIFFVKERSVSSGRSLTETKGISSPNIRVIPIEVSGEVLVP